MSGEDLSHLVKTIVRAIVFSFFCALFVVAVFFEKIEANAKILIISAFVVLVMMYRVFLDVAGKISISIKNVEISTNASFLALETLRLNPEDRSSVMDAIEAEESRKQRLGSSFDSVASVVALELGVFIVGVGVALYVVYTNYDVILSAVTRLAAFAR